MSTFSTLIGHEKAREVLLRMLNQTQLPHAMLFIGPEHVGKTTLMVALIKSLFETDRPLEVIPDVVTLERESDPKTEKMKSNLSVEQIREFTARLSMSPMLGSWKVGFIQEAERLSIAAANALLKTLEEPKGKTLMLLRASTVKDLPATIVSRCQIIRLYSVSTATITQALMKRGLGKPDAHRLAVRSFGRPGLAIDSVASSKLQAEVDVRTNTFLELLGSSTSKQFGAVTHLVSKDEQNKMDELTELLNVWEPILRDILLTQNGCAHLRVHEDKLVEIDRLATTYSARTVRMLLERMHIIRRAIPSHVNAHLSLEHLFLATSL